MIAEHVRKHGHKSVAPSVRMLRYWWGRLNDELFFGELLVPQLTYGSESTPGFTSDIAVGVTFTLGDQRVRIHIADTVTIRHGVLATLAHEMIHQWQYQHGEPMNHGQGFEALAAYIKTETGLTC